MGVGSRPESPSVPAQPAGGQAAYVTLLAAEFISLLGSQFSVVALPWFVLSTTGSPGKMTFVLLAQTLPLAIFGLPAGALVDRFDKKRLMVTLDLARGLLTVLIPLLASMGRLEFWMIVAVSFVSGTLVTPYMSARMALIPQLVGREEHALTQANTWLQLSMQITTILGPATAGVLIAAIGNLNVLYVDAATFVIAGLLLALGLRKIAPRATTRSERTWLEELREGLGFIRRHELILTIIVIGMFINLGFVVLFSATLPVFVKNVLGGEARQLGLLLSVEGVGSVIGMLIYSLLSKVWPLSPGHTIRAFLIGMVAPLWLLPLFPTLPAGLLALGMSSIFTAPIVVIIQTTLQTATPPKLQGRVFAAFNALWLLVAPLGLTIAGPLLERWGALPVLWLVCLLMTACLIASWLSPAVEKA